MTIPKNLIVISLLFLVFLLPFLSARNFSPAFDEITHLPSGYSYLKTGEIKLNPQHPPLIKMLAAFPLLFLDLKFDPNDPNLVGPQANEWQFGQDFLFNNGIDRVFFWGRIPMILLSVLLGWYIYKWSRDLFGEKAGLVALFLYAFMPNVIAHSQFVTTDLGVTAFSFIALYYLWKLTNNPSRTNVILSGLTLGLALGSKFYAVFLLPIIFILIAVYIQKTQKGSDWLLKFNSFLKIILPISGLAFLIVWALYLFPKDPLFYWHGLNTVYADRNPDYFYYLNGNFSRDGWWYYFLEAFLIKTPIPFLAALFWAIIKYKKQNLGFLNNLFIFLPVAVFLFMASWKAHNIGVRYILPIYPFLILFVSGHLLKVFENCLPVPQAGKLSRLQSNRGSSIRNESGKIVNYRMKTKIVSILVFILFGWYLLTAITIHPDYLAYFNELVGGSNNGYKYLDDSNIEWVHDLKRLAKYQKENPDLKVLLRTNIDAGKFYGIKNILPLESKSSWLNPSGKYAVSVHLVARTKLQEQIYKNKAFNWADNYASTGRIGQSFFIYEFP